MEHGQPSSFSEATDQFCIGRSLHREDGIKIFIAKIAPSKSALPKSRVTNIEIRFSKRNVIRGIQSERVLLIFMCSVANYEPGHY